MDADPARRSIPPRRYTCVHGHGDKRRRTDLDLDCQLHRRHRPRGDDQFARQRPALQVRQDRDRQLQLPGRRLRPRDRLVHRPRSRRRAHRHHSGRPPHVRRHRDLQGRAEHARPRRATPCCPTITSPSRTSRLNRNGAISFAVKVPGRGVINALGTAWINNIAQSTVLLQPARNRFVYGRSHKNSRRKATIRMRLTPNARGRRLVEHHTYAVTLRLWVTYKPTGGQQSKLGFRALHLPH